MKYLAMGDSFTEGVGDPHPLDDGSGDLVRGWADRLAADWSATAPELRYANLSVRGRLLQGILDEQLGPALDMRPDVVTLCAGGNDLIRPKADIDDLAEGMATMVDQLTGIGARVVMFTTLDTGNTPVFRLARGRSAVYTEMLREIADRRDPGSVRLVDFWRAREYSDPRLWCFDRLHMNSRGHRRMARLVAAEIGTGTSAPANTADIDFTSPVTGPEEAVDGVSREWLREFALPWVGRRVRGTSSGDGRTAKYPDWISAAELADMYRAAGARD